MTINRAPMSLVVTHKDRCDDVLTADRLDLRFDPDGGLTVWSVSGVRKITRRTLAQYGPGEYDQVRVPAEWPR